MLCGCGKKVEDDKNDNENSDERGFGHRRPSLGNLGVTDLPFGLHGLSVHSFTGDSKTDS